MQGVRFQGLAVVLASGLVEHPGAGHVHHDGHPHHQKRPQGGIHFGGTNQEPDVRLPEDPHGGSQKENGLEQRRYVLHRPVTEKVVGVSRLVRYSNGKVGHGGGGQIEGAMCGFRQNPERIGGDPNHHLHRRKAKSGQDGFEGGRPLFLLGLGVGHHFRGLLRGLSSGR